MTTSSGKQAAKYYYMLKEKPTIEHRGETVADFLARGGKINRVEDKTFKPATKRNSDGKFSKQNAPIV